MPEINSAVTVSPKIFVVINSRRRTFVKSEGALLESGHSVYKIPVKTAAGVFILEVGPRGLFRVAFPRSQPVLKSRFRIGPGASARTMVRCFANYFISPRTSLLKIKLDLRGQTLFQRRVYAALRKVPVGNVVTYGELARRAGFPGAARAVGSAMKKNRLPIVIPCHRVIPGSEDMGEYSAGKVWKRWLLEHEKIFSRNAQR